MVRGFLIHVIPLLVPFIVYAIYLYYSNKAGGEKTWQGRTVAALTMIGLVLMAFSFVAVWAIQDPPKEGTYIPQRIDENGNVIDSQIIPETKD